MRELHFVQVDVFTETAFGGNQLAVFLDCEDLDQATMETLAFEMNFSESTFVQKSRVKDCTARVRICIPRKEIPFAGHPTVGTAAVLHLRGAIPARTQLELGVGPVAVEVERQGERRARAYMIQPRTVLGPSLRVEADIARALGLAQAEVDPKFPIRVASAGLPFLLVGVRTRKALAQAQPNSALLLEQLERAPALGVMLYTLDAPVAGALVSARMFAPLASQVIEDPATGSAAGPLAAHLAECGVEAAFPGRSLVIRQGEDMGRTSVLECQVLGLADANEGVRVGGGVVVVGEGRMFVEG